MTIEFRDLGNIESFQFGMTEGDGYGDFNESDLMDRNEDIEDEYEND